MQSEGCKDECGDRCPFACHADHENDADDVREFVRVAAEQNANALERLAEM